VAAVLGALGNNPVQFSSFRVTEEEIKMSDDSGLVDFGGTEGVLRYIQERSDDIEKVIIPRSGFVTLRDRETGQETHYEAGMVFHLVSGRYEMATSRDSLAILQDGILKRMNIPVEIAD
jgi:hypothetical protein